MIGLASDSWQGQVGHYKTFTWILSVGVLLGLQITPHARHLAVLMCSHHPHWLEAALLAAAMCLMNLCIEVSYCLAHMHSQMGNDKIQCMTVVLVL